MPETNDKFHKMDVDELYLYLLALRELYILLLKSCLRDANSKLLDERAQILLKHLLDDATAGVLGFHSKNLTTDSGIFYNFLHKDDKQTKPQSEKVVEWMKHNQIPRQMGNPEMEHNTKRTRASASNVATNDLSHGISSALRRIELHILSLKRCTSQIRNTRSHINETKLAYCGNSVLQGNEALNQRNVQLRTDHSAVRTRFTELIEGHNLSSRLRNHLIGEQKDKPIVTDRCFEFVHGFRIPLSQNNDETMNPPAGETHISKQDKLVNATTLIDKSGCSVGSKATVRSKMELNQTRIQEKRSQNLYGCMIMRPTLLDHPSGEVRKEQTHNKTHLATQQESEFTNSKSNFTNSESESVNSSSSWATQQTSESKTTDDPSSPSHQDPQAAGSEGSSWYRSNSTSISTKAFRFNNGKKESKRSIGQFKRLKNKLGVIFHHHHHHHHHHPYNNHNFMWKQLRKIFHRTANKRLTSKEDRYGKLKKTAIRSVSRKNQVEKFQALAEGLRTHVWRSKAMKKKELRRLNRGKKKGLKKLHWWKMFRHRRGMKLANKGRTKIGHLNRKQ